MDWNDRINKIKDIKNYVQDNTDKFTNDRQLQFLYGSLNRSLIDLDEKILDELIIKINIELYD